MSSYPSTQQEIARLRHEERLVRAALAHANPTPAEGARVGENVGDLARLVETVWARLVAWPGMTALRVSFH